MVKKRRRGRKKSKPTGAKRNTVQSIDDRYAHAREDAQLHGRIPTTPEEALKPERVDPSVQTEQRHPLLIGTAIRRGWETPDEKKPGLVDELIATVEDPDAPAMVKVFAFNALVKGDQAQNDKDQQFIRLDRVLALWRGVLEAVRTHVPDPTVLKAITDDVLRLLPVPAGAETVEGTASPSNGEGATG